MTNFKYNLSKHTPPAMPRLGKGTECVQLSLLQVSKDMHQPLVPMLFPILGAHVSGAEFMYRPNASRSHIINFNNRNSMKNTKAKETHKCKPQEAMVSST